MKERGPRELLVGFEMEDGALPAEGCQVVRGGRARRARDERPPEPAARQDDRPRVAAARSGRGGRALRDPRRRPARAGARAAAAVLRPRRGAAAVVSRSTSSRRRRARRRRLRAARRVAARAGARRRRRHPTTSRCSASSRCAARRSARSTPRRGAAAHADARARGRSARALRGAARRAARARARRERGASPGSPSRASVLMRRLTDLDLSALPAAGKLAGVQAFVVARRRRATASSSRRSTAHSVVEAVRDAAGGARVKDIFRVRRMWRPQGELKQRYDVVIIGGGSHGLATAYYLAKNHGITQRRRAREELHRLRRRRPQHDDHPRELPHARGRGVLQRERQALRGARAPSSTSTCCSRSRATSRSRTRSGRSRR